MSFEARLADAFERYADLAPVAVEPSIAQLAVASAGPRRRAGMPGVLGRRTLVLAVLALMLLAALAAALVVGSLINRHMGLPGKFSDVGPSQIRYIAAAAGLDDGRVVVFGEARPTAPASTPDTLIELFDPATKTFKQLAAFPEPRNGFTATALRNGKVLIAGGDTTSPDGVSASMANAQLFDPVTGGLTATGSMSVGRTQHTAIRMADGRVLVIAGQSNLNGDDPFNYTAEIYDPASGAWSQAGTMTAHRSAFATTLLRDGRVLVAGGWDQVGGATDFGSVEVFDPATGYFVAVGDLLTVRRSPTAALLADGRVLLVGGYDGNTVVATAEVFDPATGRSTAAGSLLTERQNAVASTMTDGRVVVIGGSNLVGDPLSTEIYDPKSGTFAPGAFAAHEHGGPAIALPDGRILLTGATSEIYDPGATTEIALLVPRSDGMFRLTRAPVTDRTGHVATKLADGRVLLAGGLESRGARAQGYVALDSAE
ncbi:MAG: hypothetical protein ABI628_12150, partial [Chloroflexota bacterium]